MSLRLAIMSKRRMKKNNPSILLKSRISYIFAFSFPVKKNDISSKFSKKHSKRSKFILYFLSLFFVWRKQCQSLFHCYWSSWNLTILRLSFHSVSFSYRKRNVYKSTRFIHKFIQFSNLLFLVSHIFWIKI